MAALAFFARTIVLEKNQYGRARGGKRWRVGLKQKGGG